ncbi:MAG: hypothetical protein OXF93_21810 [Acidobacteria bacterium]|nr:hypothetical protein [Acidobacteriota bacterium]
MGGRHRYRFVIEEAFTPGTLPMSRLAEYMAKVSALLGEKSYVHFVGLEAGSAVLVQEVEPEAHPKVRERVQGVLRGDGPSDATQAYEALNGLLADDEASGALLEADERGAPAAQVLEFPGVKRMLEPEYGPVTQTSTLQGVVIVVGGERDPVPVHLQDGDAVHNCVAKRVVARELARHIFGSPLRVSGKGRWTRDECGRWSMSRFQIASFMPLGDDPIGEVVADLRRVAGETEMPADALAALRALRRSED